MLAEIVDGHALVQLIWVSIAAGLALVVTMSLGIFGAARASTHRREGRAASATLFAALAILAAALVAGGVALGVGIMLNKS